MAVEPLEGRALLTLNFSFNVSDPGGVLNAVYQPGGHQFSQLIVEDLNQAGLGASGALNGYGTVDVQVTITSLGAGKLAQAIPAYVSDPLYLPGLWSAAAAAESRTGVDPNGASADVFVELNADYLSNQYLADGRTPSPGRLWIDTSDDTPIGPGLPAPPDLRSDSYDLISVVTHELMHGLGFLNNPSTVYTSHIVTGGSGTYFFSGPRANAVNGGPVPLFSGSGQPGSDLSHVADADDPMYAIVAPGEKRRSASALDVGILADIGYETGYSQLVSPQPNLIVTENAGSVRLLFQLDRPSLVQNSIPFQTFNGTAVAGVDYQAVSGVVNFNPGQTTAEVVVPIFDDAVRDGTKTFQVTLLASGARTAGLFIPSLPTSYRVTIADNERTARPAANDFDGDGRADAAVFDKSTATWTIRASTAGDVTYQFGPLGSIPTPADYDGDGITDLSVFSPSPIPNSSRYYALLSSGGAINVGWGNNTIIPTPADYDGDGKADLSGFDPASATYYINYSTGQAPPNQPASPFAWGNSAIIPVLADYDGDGKADVAGFLPTFSVYYIRNSSTGVTNAFGWGNADIIPTPADYDGDGKADVAGFLPTYSIYYIGYSGTGQSVAQPWGNSAFLPTPGDYNGDGQADFLAGYDRSTGFWWLSGQSPFKIGGNPANLVPLTAPAYYRYKAVRP